MTEIERKNKQKHTEKIKRFRRLPASAACLGLLLLLLSAADLLTPDRLFSEHENRILAERPAFSRKSLLDGSFGRDYEVYLTDQFAGRDAWISLKTYAQLALGEREIRTVYFAGNDTLIERHTAENVDAALAERKAEKLASFVKALSAPADKEDRDSPDSSEGPAGPAAGDALSGKPRIAVMLVPTADCIWKEKLSRFAEEFDQSAYLQIVGEKLAEASPDESCIRIPAEQALQAHAREDIYYRTDHHWTTLGAYYGYEAYCSAMGLQAAPLEEYEKTVVTETFLGTLHSKVNVAVKPDRICIFTKKETEAGMGGPEVRVTEPLQGEPEVRVTEPLQGGPEVRVTEPLQAGKERSLYEYDRLQTKDAYAFFLGGNEPLLQLDTNAGNGRRLLVIKDSYANCLAPFLAEQYEQLLLVDPRYYRGSLEELVRQAAPDDVLILYDVIHFIENF